MYKFLGIQSRKDATNEYQPKGDYLSPLQYETKYGKVIEDKFQGYMPIGDYLFNDADKFKQSKIWPSIQTEFNKYQPKGDYTLNSTFNAYKDTVGKTYATNEDLNAHKKFTTDTFGGYKKSIGDLQTDLDAHKKFTTDSFKKLIGDVQTNVDTGLKDYLDRNLKNSLKSSFDEIEGRARRDYLTKEEFEVFKQKLMQSQPSINAAFTPVTKSPASYLRTRNYMYY